jgi:hypothetical protein
MVAQGRISACDEIVGRVTGDEFGQAYADRSPQSCRQVAVDQQDPLGGLLGGHVHERTDESSPP